MSTDAEKLAQIAALCDEHDRRWAGLVGRDAAAFTVADLRAVLAEPNPAVEGVTLTPEDCQRVLSWYRSAEVHWDATEKADRALAARLEASS